MPEASRGCRSLGLPCRFGSWTVSVYIGAPVNWQTGLQKAASPAMRRTIQLTQLTNLVLLPIAVIIPIAIIALCKRYSASNNTKWKHINQNVWIEILWTVVPIAILTGICVPSLKVLRYQINQKRKAFTDVKVTAHQWYWNYEYSFGNKQIKYDSNILNESLRSKLSKTNLKSYPKLFAVDYELVVPTKRVIKLLITSADVIHAFAVPSLGIKVDAIPGKINSAWIKTTRAGIYYGQCSEFCGKDHAYMPIAIRAVDQHSFEKWIKAAEVNISKAFRVLRSKALANG
ncbi:cytochrome c oxidase subunit II [Candidatus Hodgkinia cicadicola]